MRRWLSRLLGRQEMRERLMRLEAQLAELANATAALRAELRAARDERRAEQAAALHETAETVVRQTENAVARHVDRLDGYLVHHADRILAALPSAPVAGAGDDRHPPMCAAARPADLNRG